MDAEETFQCPHLALHRTETSSDMQPRDDLSTRLLVLDSLYPVVKCLSGLTKEKNSGHYYIHGEIPTFDQESLYDFTRCIGELTLGVEPESDSRLLNVLARISQLQDRNRPLFPYLHSLRIVRTSLSFIFLHLLLPSALTTLELTAIRVDDPCYSSVLSFLGCAIHQAPLSTLILGPGLIPDQILEISFKYMNLRCLKLLDVGISITDELLWNIGSLHALETFVLRDNGTSTYKRVPATPVSDGLMAAEDGPWGWGQCTFPESTISWAPVSNPLLSEPKSPVPIRWQTLSPEPTPPAFNEPAISPAPYYQDLELNTTLNANVIDLPPTLDSALFSSLRTFEVDGAFQLVEDLMAKISSSDLQVLSIDVTKPVGLIPPGKKKKGFRPPQISTTDIMTLLRRSTQKWSNTLVSVSFKNDSTTILPFPSDMFEILVLRPDMKHLEISGMNISSMGDTLHRLTEVAHSKFEVLHLPTHSTAPSISLAELRPIAEACPHLESFRCAFDHLSKVKASNPLSHQLKVLSVNNEQVQLPVEQKQLLEIAHYLDSIFPNLESIKTGGEEWCSIFDLVKLCQAVRMEEHRRLQGEVI